MQFGISSIPLSTQDRNYINGLLEIYALDLDAFELPFGRFISMSEESAKSFREAHEKQFAKTGKKLAISVHAPYYINLNAATPEKIVDSQTRITKAAQRAFEAGASTVVFHPGFYLKESSEVVTQKIGESIETVMASYPENYPVLRPETTGKVNQFGSVDELMLLIKQERRLNLCIDFAHLHARLNGKLNTYSEFAEILELVKTGLGDSYLKTMHIHYSGIAYTEKGERKHLPLKESDGNWQELMKALKDFQAEGTLICESPEQENDALLMKSFYTKL